ncbi:MAG: hypothetical protein ABSF38_12845 [Verrucomicrobiota bacterium]
MQESRDRVTTALTHVGFNYPWGAAPSLWPRRIPKEGQGA